jgi:hypothetical protein
MDGLRHVVLLTSEKIALRTFAAEEHLSSPCAMLHLVGEIFVLVA